MNCKTCAAKLSEYIDNELNVEDTKKTKEHLDGCGSCQKELKQLVNIKKSFSNLPKMEPAPFFETRVIGRIREAARTPKTINDFIAAAREVIFTGISIFVLILGLNIAVSSSSVTFYEGLKEYLVQNSSANAEDTIIAKSEISNDDIISLAFINEEVQ